MKLFVGFDPGGEKKFGWAICSSEGSRLQILQTGKADHAEGALGAVKAAIPYRAKIIGAGIDAPLFWVANGSRNADFLVRNAIKKLGAKTPGGTVQQVNSLRGACLVQGPLIAKLLTKQYPGVLITESHPKALLYLLGIAKKEVTPNSITVTDLEEYVRTVNNSYSEHERDAILGAVTAWAPENTQSHWKNLAIEEKGMLVPFDYKPSYWMPWNLVQAIT